MNDVSSQANPGQAREFRRGWPIVLASMFGIALGLSPMPFYTIGIFAPTLAHEFHWTFAQIFAGITCTTIAVIIASPAVGFAADRFGVRRVALTSVVLFGLSFMGLALSNGSLPLYYATWLLLALLGAGTLPITWTRAVNNGFHSGKGLALGLSLLGTGLFGYIIKPLAAWFISEFGWRGAYVAIGALPLMIALPLGLLCFRDPGERAGDPRQRRAAALTQAALTPGLTMRETLAEWRFWLIAFSFVSLAFAVGGLIPNMENILKIAGFEHADIVHLTSLIGLSVIFGRILGGWLIDRFWAPAVGLILLGAPAIACLILANPGLDERNAMLCICLIGLAAGAEYDLLAFMVARYFGMKSYGGVYGALYSFFALGAGVGPVVFGSNFDRTHAYTESLHLASALFLIPAVALLALGRYRQFTTGAAAAPLVHAGQLAVLLLASAMVFCSLPVRASDQSRGKILFLRCASCHDISETTSAKIGPNLAHVFGRKVASVKGFQYSAALRAQDFNWDTEHLDAWLTNPNAVAPGTIMAFAGLANPADRQAIIAYLRDP